MAITFKKSVKTSDMPKDIFEYLLENNYIVEDGFGKYTVDYFAAEARRASPEYKHQYNVNPAIDDWFRSQGALNGETILVEHG